MQLQGILEEFWKVLDACRKDSEGILDACYNDLEGILNAKHLEGIRKEF